MIYLILSLIIILVFVIIQITANTALNKVCNPKVRSWEETREIESAYKEWNNYDDLKKEDLSFTLDDGYLINGTFIKAPKESNKYIILTHGFRYSRLGGVKYVDIFRERNFNRCSLFTASHFNRIYIPMMSFVGRLG